MGILTLNNRNELRTVSMPERTATYYPIHHLDALEVVEEQFNRSGFQVQKENISLAQDGLVMAAKWQLQAEDIDILTSHAPTAIVLNGNTRKHTLRVGFGLNCNVCSNGMFISEHAIRRKHTRFIRQDVPEMVFEMVQGSGNWYSNFMSFLDNLKDFEPKREYVNDMLVRSMEGGVIASSHIRKVLKIFNDRTYAEYGTDTLYTLHNSYTEVLRDASSDMDLPNRTIKLNGLIEGVRNNTMARKLRFV